MAEIGETDRIEFMFFYLAVDQRTLPQMDPRVIKVTDAVKASLRADQAQWVTKYFESYLTEVLYDTPVGNNWWIIGYPEEVPHGNDEWPEYYGLWQQKVAVLRRPDEDPD